MARQVCKTLFTQDLHGNERKYRKLLDYAIEISAECILIGGDLAPTSLMRYLIEAQRRFFRRTLPTMMNRLRDKLPDVKLFLIMGNEDCRINLEVLEDYDPELFEVIHGRRTKLTGGINIMGYPYIPITPFKRKDWEKYDLSETPEDLLEDYLFRKVFAYDLQGYKSSIFGWRSFRFRSEMEKEDSIQKDLMKPSFFKAAHRTVYLFHSPPYKTNLDQCYCGNHVGSLAIRLFIEKYQPYLTLHGHVHETVEKSGDFKQKIGNTLCLTAGNNPRNDYLALLEFCPHNPWSAARKIIY